MYFFEGVDICQSGKQQNVCDSPTQHFERTAGVESSDIRDRATQNRSQAKSSLHEKQKSFSRGVL